MKRSLRSIAVFTVASIGLFSTVSVQAQHTWTATANGNWSNSPNWLGGNAPPAGGGNSVALTFLNSGSAAWTATNDLGNPFGLNSLTLNSFSSGLGTVAGTQLAFDGANAFLTNTATGNWTISAPIALNNNLTLGGPVRATRRSPASSADLAHSSSTVRKPRTT